MNLKTTKKDSMTIGIIASRALHMAKTFGIDYDLIDIQMDITACHLNGNSLKLDQLAGADDGNFGHDVFGIRRHLDRKTGKLGGCFLPRYSINQ